MGQMNNAHNILPGELEGRPRSRWKNTIYRVLNKKRISSVACLASAAYILRYDDYSQTCTGHDHTQRDMYPSY
jgi:hypothetical protein